MQPKTIIVIPVYKPFPDKFEIICLEQCRKVLGNYPMALVYPKGMNCSAYQVLINDLKLIEFPKNFFKNIHSYNRLCRSLSFYKAFQEYQFMLLHHPDAYVFSDKLDFWCKKEYDYIGAPIYDFDGTIAPQHYLGIGNGGFSLRNIQTALKILKTFKTIYSIDYLLKWYKKYNWKGRIRYSGYFIKMLLGFGRNSHHFLNNSRLNEDFFWGIYLPKVFPDYKIATFEDAYKFSMEYNCEKLMHLNNGELPFGCHQWYKGEFLNFWKKYINF